MADKLFYSYTSYDGSIDKTKLSTYYTSLIFDDNNRTIWYEGMPYGNAYVGSINGEVFNDFNNNTVGKFGHTEGLLNKNDADYSHVEGKGNTNTGEISHVGGESNVNSGSHSIVDGQSNNNSGSFSHISGKGNTNTGYFVELNGLENTSYGSYSAIFGSNEIVYGDYNLISGKNNVGHGNSNFINGANNKLTGNNNSYNVITGKDNEVNGNVDAVFGQDNIINGDNLTVSGKDNAVTGDNTVVIGINNDMNEDYNVAIGSSNNVHASNSVVIGDSNNPSEHGVAVGNGIKLENEYESSIGKYNYSESGKTIFTVGNGENENNRNSALRIDNDGAIYITKTGMHDPCNFEGKTLNANSKSLQELLAGAKLIQVTYAQLYDLREKGKLNVGTYYEIINYVEHNNCFGSRGQDYAMNPFSLLLIATSNHELSGDAIIKESNFNNELWFNGVHYYMCDDYRNTGGNVFSWVNADSGMDSTLFTGVRNIYTDQDLYYTADAAKKHDTLKQVGKAVVKTHFNPYGLALWKVKYSLDNPINKDINTIYIEALVDSGFASGKYIHNDSTKTIGVVTYYPWVNGNMTIYSTSRYVDIYTNEVELYNDLSAIPSVSDRTIFYKYENNTMVPISQENILVKYCIYNGCTGVITSMEDEYGNKTNYNFKEHRFKFPYYYDAIYMKPTTTNKEYSYLYSGTYSNGKYTWKCADKKLTSTKLHSVVTSSGSTPATVSSGSNPIGEITNTINLNNAYIYTFSYIDDNNNIVDNSNTGYCNNNSLNTDLTSYMAFINNLYPTITFVPANSTVNNNEVYSTFSNVIVQGDSTNNIYNTTTRNSTSISDFVIYNVFTNGSNIQLSGNNLLQNSSDSKVFGRYNKKDDNGIFTIGNGTGNDNRSNALTVTTSEVVFDSNINVKPNNSVSLFGSSKKSPVVEVSYYDSTNGGIVNINNSTVKFADNNGYTNLYVDSDKVEINQPTYFGQKTLNNSSNVIITYSNVSYSLNILDNIETGWQDNGFAEIHNNIFARSESASWEGDSPKTLNNIAYFTACNSSWTDSFKNIFTFTYTLQVNENESYKFIPLDQVAISTDISCWMYKHANENLGQIFANFEVTMKDGNTQVQHYKSKSFGTVGWDMDSKSAEECIIHGAYKIPFKPYIVTKKESSRYITIEIKLTIEAKNTGIYSSGNKNIGPIICSGIGLNNKGSLSSGETTNIVTWMNGKEHTSDNYALSEYGRYRFIEDNKEKDYTRIFKIIKYKDPESSNSPKLILCSNGIILGFDSKNKFVLEYTYNGIQTGIPKLSMDYYRTGQQTVISDTNQYSKFNIFDNDPNSTNNHGTFIETK